MGSCDLEAHPTAWQAACYFLLRRAALPARPVNLRMRRRPTFTGGPPFTRLHTSTGLLSLAAVGSASAAVHPAELWLGAAVPLASLPSANGWPSLFSHALCTRHTLRTRLTASTLALHVAPCSQVLGELGPFRHFNCLWGEAYIQILKAMFRMTNWKSAPYDVAVHWATKSVMHYRNPNRGSWYEDSVTPSTEFYYDLKSLKSPLADALIQTEPYIHALRFVSQLRRGPDVVRLNDCSMSARVDSIAQITRSDSSASYVRLWCAQPRTVSVDAEFSQWSERCDSLHPMLVKLETTQVRAVTCDVQSTRYVFN